MINLLVAYYENIGPFKDTYCSLFFDEGKYLIKAPVGSGKSFLFFDAPRYALYKDSNRNMLNLQSKNGEISLIFEVDGNYYLVKRMLKSTKIGNDSCSSQLFSISYKGENLIKSIKSLTGNAAILQRGENVIEKFESENGNLRNLDEIIFKNETDLQSSFEELLPPKEVFLNTVFLLQDADNIFEMRPADRLIVLKNVFNLLGIDDAKEKIQEKKKEVGYKLKALQDHSLQDNKLRALLKDLWEKIKELENDNELKNILSGNDHFFEDIEGFFEQVSIGNFSLNGLEKGLFEKAEALIQEKIDVVIKLNTQIGEFKNLQDSLLKQKHQNERDINLNKMKIVELQSKIDNIDTKKGDYLKETKMKFYEKGENLEKNVNYLEFRELISFWNQKSIGDDSMDDLEMPISLKSAYELLQIVKNGGVRLKSMMEFESSKLENIYLQEKNWKDNHDKELEKIIDLKMRKEDEIKQLNIRIEEIDKMRAETADFDCPDLCKKCPHINAINKQQFDQYSQQKEKLIQTLEFLKTDYGNQKYEDKIKHLENEKNPEGEDLKNDLKKMIEEQTEFSNSLKDYLYKIGFLEREKSYHEWESIQIELQNIDKQLFQWEQESKNLESYQKEKVAVETSLKHLEKSLQEQENQINSLNIKISEIQTIKEKYDSQYLQQEQQDIKHILQIFSQVEQLVEDSVSNQNLMNKLKEDEKKLSRLYSILSKEIVLFALDDYLPVLSDVINDYLSQCVDYSIRMQIVENGEKLELDAKIFDLKGEREVKSLSGGQRTVLKLVWMLAVSSYLHTPLLFLDETINNLDIDTIGRVSEMINNFVKQRTMKFYTVTHNKEIQDMQIWDDVIEIN